MKSKDPLPSPHRNLIFCKSVQKMLYVFQSLKACLPYFFANEFYPSREECFTKTLTKCVHDFSIVTSPPRLHKYTHHPLFCFLVYYIQTLEMGLYLIYVYCMSTILHSHGALDLQPLKKRAQSARRKDRTATTEVNKPKEVTDFEEEEESTTKDVMHVFSCLKKKCEREGRVHYFTFLVDPTSFAHTVENMFHFAFLIKVRERGLVFLVEEGLV